MIVRALAHRGDPVNCPENTMAAFQSAYDKGFTHIELDVQLSKDGVAVVMHDVTLDRTTNGTGWLKDYTWEALQKLTVGESEKIPTLEEALLFAKDKINVSVELKQQGDLYPGLEEEVWHIIQKTGMTDQVYVNSFDHFSIQKMRSITDELALGLIQPGATPAVIPYMKEINAKYLSVKVEFLTDKFVDMCEASDIQLVTWPVNHPWQFDKVSQYPSILSTTDRLDFFKEMYTKSEIHR